MKPDKKLEKPYWADRRRTWCGKRWEDQPREQRRAYAWRQRIWRTSSEPRWAGASRPEQGSR